MLNGALRRPELVIVQPAASRVTSLCFRADHLPAREDSEASLRLFLLRPAAARRRRTARPRPARPERQLQGGYNGLKASSSNERLYNMIDTISQTAYEAARRGAGLIDRSDRGRIVVSGQDRAEYLQGLLSNDIVALKPGGGCYADVSDAAGPDDCGSARL